MLFWLFIMDYIPRWFAFVILALGLACLIGLWEGAKYVWRHTHVSISMSAPAEEPAK